MRSSVVIPTYNRAESLKRCLDSIITQSVRPFEVVIIDDGDLGADYLAAAKASLQKASIQFTYYKKDHSKEKRGLSESKNIAVDIVSSEIFCMLDDDLVLHADFLKHILSVWETNADDKLIGVGGVISNNRKKGVLEGLFNEVFALTSPHAWDVTPVGFQVWDDWISEKQKGYYAHGGVSSYKKSLVKQLGGFSVFSGGRTALEDVDLSLRAKNAGYHFIIEPKATVIHEHEMSGRESAYRSGWKESANRTVIFKNNCPQDVGHRIWFEWSSTGWITKKLLAGKLDEAWGMCAGGFSSETGETSKTNHFLKRILFRLEADFPALGSFLIQVLRTLRAWYYRVFLTLHRFKHPDIDPQKIIHISPKDVVFVGGVINVRTDRGTVAAGTWDIERTRFEDTPTYRGMHERFVEKKEWKDTNHYAFFAKRIANGEVYWRCTTVPAFEEYLRNVDALFADIKKHGYREQGDPGRVEMHEGKHDKTYEPLDEISVNIGHDGTILFADGAHRLAIAKILGLETVPALVIKRHTQWTEFHTELVAFAHQSPGEKLYQMAFHPDLADVPYAHGLERWPALEKALKGSHGRVLDVGSNFGLLCYKIERVYGLTCTSVEINPQETYFSNKMRDALGCTFEIRTQSVFDINKKTLASYDVVLALNIFHHFLKRETEYNRLVTFLQTLDCQEMFFESHNPDEPQMTGAYRNFAPDEFAQFVIDNSCLKKAQRLGEFSGGRVLFRISR